MLRGLIIDSNYENAENTKLIMEDIVEDLEMDIFDPEKEGVTIIPTEGYDFILAPDTPAKKHVLEIEAVPFIETVLRHRSDFISVRKNKEVVFVDRSAIVGIEVINKNCYIYTMDNDVVITRITLHELIDLLEIPTLLRCHKSYALNVKFVTGVKKEGRNRGIPRFSARTDFRCCISDMYLDHIIEMAEKVRSITVSKYIK